MLAIGDANAVVARVMVETHVIAHDAFGVVIQECGNFVEEELRATFIGALLPFPQLYLDGVADIV